MNQNDFQFAKSLDFKLVEIIERHGERKPVLVFVSTRKGVLSTAEALMREYQSKEDNRNMCPWAKPTRYV
jgi:ATP-dependent DNA helicase HFM1/MER3